MEAPVPEFFSANGYWTSLSQEPGDPKASIDVEPSIHSANDSQELNTSETDLSQEQMFKRTDEVILSVVLRWNS